jgi:hypothetical protein
MKFELVPVGKGDYGQTEYGLYVTKNEILKAFDKDKGSCLEELSTITEMLTTPCCYHSGWTSEHYAHLIKRLKEKTTHKGIFFLNVEDDIDNNFKLGYSFKK